MRKGLLGLVLVVAVLLLWRAGPWCKTDMRARSATAAQGEPPRLAENQPVQIFERAFWARPTAADKILHAERHEWRDIEGLQKWQWFLVVEPSPALLKRLRDDNVFGLVSATTVTPVDGAPEWFNFKPDAVSVLKAPQGQLQLIFSPFDKILYATDSGAGFRPGTAETNAIPLPRKMPSPSRLPAMSPPSK